MKKITLPYQSRLNHPSFTFGVATSSFQIEGDIAGREPCIWDSFCQQPNAIKDGSNGNVACDHIHRWQEDVELIKYKGWQVLVPEGNFNLCEFTFFPFTITS